MSLPRRRESRRRSHANERRRLRLPAGRPGRGGARRCPGLSQDPGPAGRAGAVPGPDRRGPVHLRRAARRARLDGAPRSTLARVGRLGALAAPRAGVRDGRGLHPVLHPGVRVARLPADRGADPAGAVPGAEGAAGPRRADRGRGDRRHPLRLLQAAARAPALGRAQGSRLVNAVLQAFAMVFEPTTLVAMLLASLFGLFVGAVPGLTATMATALLVPVTFFMAPIPAIATIVTATAMAIFSGDVPGCLLRIPGTPASAAYTDEAYALTRKGQAELALGAGLVFSAIGGLFGTAV